MPADSIDHATRLKDWENHADQAAGWRLLSGKTEREVADNIAFLAAADPGPEYVAAACVEEKKGGGIVFRLAMNEGVLNEGVPRRVVDGLRGICAELEAAAANGERIFRVGRAIVSNSDELQNETSIRPGNWCLRRYWCSIYERS